MVAITGANGLVGSAIVQKLLSEGILIRPIKRKNSKINHLNNIENPLSWQSADLLDIHSLNDAFQDVSTVIHTAAMVSFNPRNEKELFQVNVEGTKNVVNACIAKGVKKLIHISSVAALGRQKGSHVIDEQNKWIESPYNSMYAKSKYLAELEVYRGMEEGLEVSIINLSLILAPSDWNYSSAQLFKYVWNENKFYTNGLCNYVDVRDVATIASQLIKTNFKGERFIISAGAISYKDLFDQIASRLNKKTPSIKIYPKLLSVIAILEEIRCSLLGSQPLITRESIKSTREQFTFNNQKSIQRLINQYLPLSETLDFCCEYYVRTYSTNK